MTWSVGIIIMWRVACFRLGQLGNVEIRARFLAALDLASAMKEELTDVGEVPDTLTDRQLNRCITKRLDGGRIKVQTLTTQHLGTNRRLRNELWKWVKKEKWWIGILTMLIAVDFYALFTLPDSPGLPLFWSTLCGTAGVHFAVVVGRAWKSRLFIAFCGAIVGIIPWTPILTYQP